MRLLRICLIFAVVSAGNRVFADEPVSADAWVPEHLRGPISELDHPDFVRREAAVKQLSSLGVGAIPALMVATEVGSPEASVRAFDVLQQLYRGDDEAAFEMVELVLRRLKGSEHLGVAARAERAFDSGAENRQKRAIARLERLGGIIHFSDPVADRPPLGRPAVDYVMLGRDWVGEEADLRLLARIEDLRLSMTQLYIIRGIEVSERTLFDLTTELPFLKIERRGPARLGIRGRTSDDGCVIHAIDPGSAAEEAGMKIRDEVIEIDGIPIDSFEKLIEIIGEKEPGEKVPVVFRRGDETHKVTAKLTAWAKPAAANVPPQPRP